MWQQNNQAVQYVESGVDLLGDERSSIHPRPSQRSIHCRTWHSAGTPELIRSEVVNGTVVDFQWRAVGSAVYSVTAKGEIQQVDTDSNGTPLFDTNSFRVVCSCPDGDRQQLESRSSNELYVCKHGKAALDSVLDATASAKIKANKEAAVAEARLKAEERKKYLIEQRQLQDREMPGERERIHYGLSKRSDEDIAKLVKKAAMTMGGLKALTKIFPEEVMPPKQTIRCGRCDQEYDPQIPSDRVCREEHPEDKCKMMWDGSKKSWEHCRRCGKDFRLDGFHSWGKRKRDDPEDEGPYCYETVHVPMEDYDEDDDPIMQNLDDSDY